jgi:hypothetical protein
MTPIHGSVFAHASLDESGNSHMNMRLYRLKTRGIDERIAQVQRLPARQPLKGGGG